jgi:hypothetical protein
MKGLINNTYIGGLIAHLVILVPYLFGSVVYIAPIVFLSKGHTKIATALFGLASITSLQYVITIPKWPAFRRWFINLGPRAYYKKCVLDESNLDDIKDEKVGVVEQYFKTHDF